MAISTALRDAIIDGWQEAEALPVGERVSHQRLVQGERELKVTVNLDALNTNQFVIAVRVRRRIS